MNPKISSLLISIGIISLQFLPFISGHAVNLGETCVLGATDHYYCEQSLNHICDPKTLKCVCKFGLPNKETLCQAGYDFPCNDGSAINSTEFCNQDRFLKCTEGKCGCENSSIEIYDVDLERCAVTANTEGCTMTALNWTLNCVSNAFCEMTMDGDAMVHTCRCNPGYEIDPGTNSTCTKSSSACPEGLLPNQEGICQASHGSRCIRGSGDPVTQCNSNRFLTCTSTGTCECDDPKTQVFDERTQRCALKLDEDGCEMSPEEWTLNCVSDAYCEMFMSGSTMTHTCVKCNNFDQDTFACLDQGSSSHMMSMYFHAGKDEIVLFKFWETKKTGWFILSLILIFLMAVAYEGLKYARDTMLLKEPSPGDQNGSTLSKILNRSHLIQTLLHMIQFVLSYFLMLIFMTYNIWLAVAVTLGAGTGYLCFGWNRKTSTDKNGHCG